MFRSTEAWIREYENRAAYWLHDGNPKRPHALMTSGNHSNGFFWSQPVIDDDKLRDEAASDLLETLGRLNVRFGVIDCVVGPATGATLLARSICECVGKRQGSPPCAWASPEKEGEGIHRRMVFKDASVFPGDLVFLCEDVLSTGGSAALAAEAVKSAGGKVAPYVMTLVNRSGLVEVNGMKIVSLIDQSMPIWTPDECPLCKAGSEAIRPKNVENWALLNTVY